MRQARYIPELQRFLQSLPPAKGKRGRARKYWGKFLVEAPSNEDEWKKAEDYAEDWRFCACGSLLPEELRECSDSFWPKDSQLERLGYKFLNAVEKRNWEKARKIFLKIQQREAQVINELKLKNPDFS